MQSFNKMTMSDQLVMVSFEAELATMHMFALLRRTHDKSDYIKTFNTFESQIMVFGNISWNKNCSHK